MRSRRLPLGLILPVALAALVVTLAVLQYRWLGQVSAAERERMKTTMMQRAEAFARDFDREVLHLYLALQTESAGLAQQDWTAFARRYDLWRESAEYPQLVKGIYVVEHDPSRSPVLQYRPESRTFEPSEWPAELSPVRRRIEQTETRPSDSKPSMQARSFLLLREPIVASVPALVISLPVVQTMAPADMRSQVQFRFTSRFLIAHLDRAYLESALLPALAARHFPERDAADYRFAVVETQPTAATVYSHGVARGAVLDPASADAVVPFFTLRLDLSNQMSARAMLLHGANTGFDVMTLPPPPPPAPVPGWVGRATVRTSETPPLPRQVAPAPLPPQRSGGGGAGGRGGTVSIFVEQRGAQVSDYRVTQGLGSPAWQFVVQHTAGSLDAAVARARRRNLWLSFGILSVLASGVGLVVLNARRSERLAAQQMDFVATVSHELRTPLAVIRSAAQNLSAGVVHEAAQARRYGDLIEQEGRRLTDMVEQVLAYAGVSDTRGLVSARATDVGAIVTDVLAASAPLVESAGFEQVIHIAPDLPLVMADEGAVQRALHNLVTNALKYGAEGRWLGVTVQRVAASRARDADEVQIAVSDRGRGIDTQDLPHIFEPFYRGRFAIDRQIHGNGLGLSLVKRIAEAHGGRVSVRSSSDQGTTFTLHLPALSEVEAPALSEIEGPALTEVEAPALSETDRSAPGDVPGPVLSKADGP
ncbi:MAG TPA: HAMP domain-containing sensor histidine kinase [Vicinamibacterales bacterium]|nr:HAMP domain-containing sensor histidine kinase [Vicinamibacterales bacterium]